MKYFAYFPKHSWSEINKTQYDFLLNTMLAHPELCIGVRVAEKVQG